MKYIRIIVCLLFIVISSCDKKYNSDIPYASVNFIIDLRYEDKDLVGILSHKEFTSPRKGNDLIGYSGILVVCGFDNIYYAYDLCCPHEAKKSIKITANDDGTATCSTCGTKYDIGYGSGAPVEGVSKYRLRVFNVTPNGQELYISY